MKIIGKLPGFLKWLHWLKDDKKTCKKMFVITFGSAIQSIFLVMLMLSSTFIIAHYLPKDHAALNGASIAISVFTLMLFMVYSANQGCNILIGQVKGVKDVNKVKELVRYKFILSACIITVWILIFKLVGENRILSLVLGPLDITGVHDPDFRAEILKNGTIFLNWLIWSIIPFIVSLIIYSTSRVHGHIKMCITGAIIALCINVVLALWLVGAFHDGTNLGIKGTGIAILVTRIIECFVLIVSVVISQPKWSPGLNFWTVSKWTIKKGLFFTGAIMVSDILFPVFLILQQAIVARAADRLNDPNILTAVNAVTISSDLLFSILLGFYSVGPLFIGAKIAGGQITKSKENAEKMLIVAFLMILGSLIIGCTEFWWWAPSFNLQGEAARYCSWFILGSVVGMAIYGWGLQMLILLRTRGYILTASICEEPVNMIVFLPFIYCFFRYTHVDPAITLCLAPIIAAIFLFTAAWIPYHKYKWYKPII